MRKPVIAANWKMYKTTTEAVDFCRRLRPMLAAEMKSESIIFAPFTALAVLQEELSQTAVAIGAQNFYPQGEGAYTGEISLPMLKELGVSHVLIGHSERRSIFKEDEPLIREKVRAALTAEVTPLLCVGESLAVREKGQAIEYCLGQIESALQGLDGEQIRKILIAYEPIWAIGSGQCATPDDAEDMLGGIRRYLAERFGEETAQSVRLLYGGSVKPENIAELTEKENIDGALIGGASLNAESYSQMLRLQER